MGRRPFRKKGHLGRGTTVDWKPRKTHPNALEQRRRKKKRSLPRAGKGKTHCRGEKSFRKRGGEPGQKPERQKPSRPKEGEKKQRRRPSARRNRQPSPKRKGGGSEDGEVSWEGKGGGSSPAERKRNAFPYPWEKKEEALRRVSGEKEKGEGRHFYHLGKEKEHLLEKKKNAKNLAGRKMHVIRKKGKKGGKSDAPFFEKERVPPLLKRGRKRHDAG